MRATFLTSCTLIIMFANVTMANEIKSGAFKDRFNSENEIVSIVASQCDTKPIERCMYFLDGMGTAILGTQTADNVLRELVVLPMNTPKDLSAPSPELSTSAVTITRLLCGEDKGERVLEMLRDVEQEFLKPRTDRKKPYAITKSECGEFAFGAARTAEQKFFFVSSQYDEFLSQFAGSIETKEDTDKLRAAEKKLEERKEKENETAKIKREKRKEQKRIEAEKEDKRRKAAEKKIAEKEERLRIAREETDQRVALALATSGDAESGAKVYLKCKACHSSDPDRKMNGPYLGGFLGRNVASDEAFAYSEALLSWGEGKQWTAEGLAKFLGGTEILAPGKKKRFILKDSTQIRDVISYLVEENERYAELIKVTARIKNESIQEKFDEFASIWNFKSQEVESVGFKDPVEATFYYSYSVKPSKLYEAEGKDYCVFRINIATDQYREGSKASSTEVEFEIDAFDYNEFVNNNDDAYYFGTRSGDTVYFNEEELLNTKKCTRKFSAGWSSSTEFDCSGKYFPIYFGEDREKGEKLKDSAFSFMKSCEFFFGDGK